VTDGDSVKGFAAFGLASMVFTLVFGIGFVFSVVLANLIHASIENDIIQVFAVIGGFLIAFGGLLLGIVVSSKSYNHFKERVAQNSAEKTLGLSVVVLVFGSFVAAIFAAFALYVMVMIAKVVAVFLVFVLLLSAIFGV